MLKRYALLCVFLTGLVAAGCEAAQAEPVTATEIVEVTRIVEVTPVAGDPDGLPIVPGVTIDVRQYQSLNGREYVVYVFLPLSYEASGDQSYPVMYVTDGDWYTVPIGMANAQLAFGQEMPEVIVVGVGYGGSFMNAFTRREEDMTPEGAESFLSFLEDELVPDIEANYRAASTPRTLVGHSLGGAFSLYAAFLAGDTFDQFVASSPSCGEACLAALRDYAADQDALPVRLFVSAGELDQEVLATAEDFWAALQLEDFAGLTGEMVVLDGETHLSSRPRAFTTGAKWVFSGSE